MIIVRLKGGMGNQMFQYAFGRRIADLHQTQLKLDLSMLLDRNKGDFVYRDYDLSIFNIQPEFVIDPSLLRFLFKIKSKYTSRIVSKLSVGSKNYIKEKHFHVVEDVLQHPPNNTIYEGWWQSEQYFKSISKDIRKDFFFKQDILSDSLSLYHDIKNTNAVCLNVRRTDFLKIDALNTTNLDYFLRSAKYMGEQLTNPVFYIFSDDVEWCIQNIKLEYPVRIVNHEHKGEKFSNYLQLMIACQHFIIPNSSFAWWAVWLNENPSKIVVAPQNWFADPQFNTKDIVPKNWIRL